MIYNIGITGTGSLIGQGIIKSIKNSKYSKIYKLIGFDYFKDTVGSFWCDKNHILPDIYKKTVTEKKWLSTLIEIILNEKIDILFTGVDFELVPLSKNKKYIENKTRCKIIVSELGVIKTGNDKYLTYKFLKKNGLNFPKTYLPKNCDFDKLNWPIIVKPRQGARSRGVYEIKNKKELVTVLKSIENPIIQEKIGDKNSEYTCGIIYFNGQLKQKIVLKRSLKDGNTYISEHSNNYKKNIYNYIEDISHILKPFGSCNLQIRVDSEGIPKLFEINPRHSGTTYIRSLFGYNEVIYILKYLLENESIKFNMKEGKALRFYHEKLLDI